MTYFIDHLEKLLLDICIKMMALLLSFDVLSKDVT